MVSKVLQPAPALVPLASFQLQITSMALLNALHIEDGGTHGRGL
jgi:hypothetical protein